MKFTIVFTTLLCVSTSYGVLAKTVEDPKDKREASASYGSPAYSSQSFQAPAAYSQEDASAISVGAGYSIGGGKPTYSFAGQGSSANLQIPSEGLSPNGHATIQLAPITLQPGHGGFASGDLSQLMNQLTHSLNTGAISFQPSNTVAEFHQGSEGVQGLAQGQQLSLPQFSYGAPKYEISQQFSSAPSYSSGAKSLNPFTSTGPVLFNPSDLQSGTSAAPSLTYGAAASGHSLGDAGSLSLGGSGQSFGGSSHSLGGSGLSLGGSGHALGGSGYSLGGSGHSFGNSLAGLNLGGVGPSYAGSYKQLSGGYTAPSKTSFKPSTFLGSSVQSESGSGHGISSLSGSYGAPSFGSFRGGNHGGLTLSSAGHGASFGGSQGFGSGSSKFIAPSYQSYKSEGLEGANALSSGHFSSPPGTTYGIPSSSFSNNLHSASSNKPYYVSTKHYRGGPSSFGHGSSAHRSPLSSHSSISSFSSGPKYSYGGSSSQYEPTDAHGSASETSYNTIKYSEQLKPIVN
ncbi:unnamed protein product [Arctia plantaginis]|uniref:Uncharacterized protein n=1 Tax=Arctia plantaginis TaxID=874455 RepID=A0A8S1BCL1_ARCPL|nr:unnamed protein product [Arctia plantaginis]